jgi:hypothetical protein
MNLQWRERTSMELETYFTLDKILHK